MLTSRVDWFLSCLKRRKHECERKINDFKRENRNLAISFNFLSSLPFRVKHLRQWRHFDVLTAIIFVIINVNGGGEQRDLCRRIFYDFNKSSANRFSIISVGETKSLMNEKRWVWIFFPSVIERTNNWNIFSYPRSQFPSPNHDLFLSITSFFPPLGIFNIKCWVTLHFNPTKIIFLSIFNRNDYKQSNNIKNTSLFRFLAPLFEFRNLEQQRFKTVGKAKAPREVWAWIKRN